MMSSQPIKESLGAFKRKLDILGLIQKGDQIIIIIFYQFGIITECKY